MKRVIAIILAIGIALCGVCFAEDEGLRFKIKEDSSTLTVGDELDHAQEDNADSATIHTDVYLFVNPDTASYVTFTAVDDEDRLIPGASIYISYKGNEELCGVTDENGQASMYLFRDVEYGYSVQKNGYETASGRFIAREELKKVKVVLKKYRIVTLRALRNGEPWPDATMYANEQRIFGDENGTAVVRLVNGNYALGLSLDDGRIIYEYITVNGDGEFEINFIPDNTIVPNGTYSDRFLVYNGIYTPKDYVYSEFLHTADDVERLPDETDEDYRQRVRQYLDEHPNEVIVNALPINGEILSRIMIPSGFLQRQWEAQGFEKIAFTNGREGLRIDLNDWYNPQMTRAFALLYAMTEGKPSEIVENMQDYPGSRLQRMMNQKYMFLNGEALNGIKDFCFDFAPTEKTPRLPASLYVNTCFEYCLSPIDMNEFLDILQRAADMSEEPNGIVLANDAYFREEILKWYAEDGISYRTLLELTDIMADHLFSAEEAARLMELIRQNQIDADSLTQLLSHIVEDSVYRVSCRIRRGDVYLDVTELLPTLNVFWDADDLDDSAEYRAVFVRELMGEDGTPLGEAPTDGNPNEMAQLFETELDSKIREVTIIVNPSAHNARKWTADVEDGGEYPQPLRILKGEAPFAGVNALIQMDAEK